MYANENRLPKNTFRAVFDTATRLHMYEMTIAASRNIENKNRFAVIVGKTIHKRAVIRNRIKRLIRESLHHLLPRLVPGVDIVIIAKKDFSGEKQTDVETLIKQGFTKLHLIATP